MRTLHEQTECHARVDDVLGDPNTRYFGAGYRQVQHHIFAVHIDTRAGVSSAAAEVIYPRAWSTKQNRALTPHLSSIDAFTIAAELIEAYATRAFALNPEQIQRCWLRDCTIKSGATPTLELSSVPVNLRLVSTQADSRTMCGYLSAFKIRIGSINLDMTLDHPMTASLEGRIAVDELDAWLGPHDRRYYGAGYKSSRVQISNIVLDREVGQIRSTVALDYAVEGVRDGLSGHYVPFISMVDALVGTAQLAETLLYRRDNITRGLSGTMWMRKLSMSMPRPMAPPPNFDVATWIRQATLLPVGGRRWRTAKLAVSFLPLTGEYCLAHELPEQVLTPSIPQQAQLQ